MMGSLWFVCTMVIWRSWEGVNPERCFGLYPGPGVVGACMAIGLFSLQDQMRVRGWLHNRVDGFKMRQLHPIAVFCLIFLTVKPVLSDTDDKKRALETMKAAEAALQEAVDDAQRRNQEALAQLERVKAEGAARDSAAAEALNAAEKRLCRAERNLKLIDKKLQRRRTRASRKAKREIRSAPMEVKKAIKKYESHDSFELWEIWSGRETDEIEESEVRAIEFIRALREDALDLPDEQLPLPILNLIKSLPINSFENVLECYERGDCLQSDLVANTVFLYGKLPSLGKSGASMAESKTVLVFSSQERFEEALINLGLVSTAEMLPMVFAQIVNQVPPGTHLRINPNTDFEKRLLWESRKLTFPEPNHDSAQ